LLWAFGRRRGASGETHVARRRIETEREVSDTRAGERMGAEDVGGVCKHDEQRALWQTLRGPSYAAHARTSVFIARLVRRTQRFLFATAKRTNTSLAVQRLIQAKRDHQKPGFSFVPRPHTQERFTSRRSMGV
jgi:hypothetical protein